MAPTPRRPGAGDVTGAATDTARHLRRTDFRRSVRVPSRQWRSRAGLRPTGIEGRAGRACPATAVNDRVSSFFPLDGVGNKTLGATGALVPEGAKGNNNVCVFKHFQRFA